MIVTIIIPVYQVADYIERCVQSVIRQTVRDGCKLECIIVDDCGTDDSVVIVKRLIKEYDGPISFILVSHEHNRGLSAARNTGLQHASGEYVFFLDGDDELADETMNLMAEKVVTDSKVELVQGKTKKTRWSFRKSEADLHTNSEIRKCFYSEGPLKVNAWNKLIKRDFLNHHNIIFQEGVIFEDTPWMFDMLKYLTNVSFVSEVTYHYKIRNHSIVSSSSNIERAGSFAKNFRYIINKLTSGHEQEELTFYAIKFSYIYCRYARYSMELKNDFKNWQNYTRTNGLLFASTLLAISRFLSRFRYGWLCFFIWSRVVHPEFVPTDIIKVAKRNKGF